MVHIDILNSVNILYLYEVREWFFPELWSMTYPSNQLYGSINIKGSGFTRHVQGGETLAIAALANKRSIPMEWHSFTMFRTMTVCSFSHKYRPRAETEQIANAFRAHKKCLVAQKLPEIIFDELQTGFKRTPD